MKRLLVSLGLPVFNGAEFLDACLRSIAMQTYGEFELVICDNASTDATAQIAADWCKRDPRFAYHRSPENRGAARNFNWTFELARGEYFKWCAADDLLAPTFLARCVEALETRREAVLAYPGTLQIDRGGTVTGEIYDNHVEMGFDASDAPGRLHGLMLNNHSCIAVFGLIRSCALRGSSLIQPYPGSDRALLVELALRAPFVRVDENLLLHREHAGRSVTMYPRLRDRAEWFSGRRGRMSFPNWRLLSEYALAVRGVRMPVRHRLQCAGSFLRWIYWGGWRGMLADITQQFR